MRGSFTPLTQVEQEWANIKKAVRAAIRLKYQIQADEEINAALPKVQDSYSQALLEGRPFELDTDSYLKDER